MQFLSFCWLHFWEGILKLQSNSCKAQSSVLTNTSCGIVLWATIQSPSWNAIAIEGTNCVDTFLLARVVSCALVNVCKTVSVDNCEVWGLLSDDFSKRKTSALAHVTSVSKSAPSTHSQKCSAVGWILAQQSSHCLEVSHSFMHTFTLLACSNALESWCASAVGFHASRACCLSIVWASSAAVRVKLIGVLWASWNVRRIKPFSSDFSGNIANFCHLKWWVAKQQKPEHFIRSPSQFPEDWHSLERLPAFTMYPGLQVKLHTDWYSLLHGSTSPSVGAASTGQVITTCTENQNKCCCSTCVTCCFLSECTDANSEAWTYCYKGLHLGLNSLRHRHTEQAECLLCSQCASWLDTGYNLDQN